jgi:hypothetical protein
VQFYAELNALCVLLQVQTRKLTYHRTGFVATDMAPVHHLHEDRVPRLNWDTNAGDLHPIFLCQMVLAHRAVSAEVVSGFSKHVTVI